MKKSQICCAIWPWGIKSKESMETAIKEVTEIGYKSFESVRQAIGIFEMDSKPCLELMDKYGITADSFYFHLPFKGKEDEIFGNLERELQFVCELGIKRLCLQGVCGRPENDIMDEAEREYNLNMINKFANIAKEFDLATNVHPHVGTYFMYEDEIDYVMENTDPKLVHFAPDTAHIAAAGADPVAVVKRYAERVNFTHLKDYRLGDEVTSEGWVDSGVPIMDCFHGLGMGTVDFPEIFKILDEVGYSGPLCAELDKTPTTHKDSAKKNFDYLNKYLED